MVAAVPRLLANLIGDGSPLGGSVWGEDAIVLPPGGGGRVYRYLFTGEIVEATDTREGHHLLRVSAVFSSFPLALLVCVKGG